jgi:uncharacterized membrane protein
MPADDMSLPYSSPRLARTCKFVLPQADHRLSFLLSMLGCEFWLLRYFYRAASRRLSASSDTAGAPQLEEKEAKTCALG